MSALGGQVRSSTAVASHLTSPLTVSACNGRGLLTRDGGWVSAERLQTRVQMSYTVPVALPNE